MAPILSHKALQDSLVVNLTESTVASIAAWLPHATQLLLATTTSLAPSFLITSHAYDLFEAGDAPDTLFAQVDVAVTHLAGTMSQRRSQETPFLLSLTPLTTCPGPHIVSAIPYLGLTPELVLQLGQLSNPQFALEVYGRFWQTFGHQVLAISRTAIAEIIDPLIVQLHTEPQQYQFSDSVTQLNSSLANRTSVPLPITIEEQLHRAITALYTRWQHTTTSEAAANNGLALHVQVIVLGNVGEESGSGTACSRSPYTGEDGLCGEFVPGAHIEEAISGAYPTISLAQFKAQYPSLHAELAELAQRLEKETHHLLQIDFVVEQGHLYILDVNLGRSTDRARLKIAVDMAHAGIINQADAVQRINPASLSKLLHPTLAPGSRTQVVARGLPASPGIVSGNVVLDPSEAQRRAARGEPLILVREETSPQDFVGIVAAKGLLTTKGGTTSHAAVVARGMGKVCIVGANTITIDGTDESLQIGPHCIRKGEALTLDGTNGHILLGSVTTVESEPPPEMSQLLAWADEMRVLGVRANVDTPTDAVLARKIGAEGVGLCRIEHLCLRPDRLVLLQQIILLPNSEARNAALKQLQTLLQEDFSAIFAAMSGYPVTIRLLDPPLHEFLPRKPEQLEALAQALSMDVRQIAKQIDTFQEVNPMMGLRGCRLTLVQPDLLTMQVKAVLLAAFAMCQQGHIVHPEIMVPFVMNAPEIQDHVQRIHAEARATQVKLDSVLNYRVGAMIELPCAALVADEIARYVDFFSFGTNDLTQATLGLSRDDSASFLPAYLDRNWLPADPFLVIDRQGVGKLVQEAVRLGRASRPDLIIGACGEHAGNPESIEFFYEIGGLDYISCSPRQIPIARLAAAQAVLAHD
jgi:pyruvate,orthophosphate dikinase